MRRTAFRNGGTIFGRNTRRLGRLKELFDIPIAAFTATATPRVQREIVANLRLRQPLVWVHGFYRPESLFRGRDGSQLEAPSRADPGGNRRRGSVHRLLLFPKASG